MNAVTFASTDVDTSAIFAQRCYDKTSVFDGKDSACYLFMNPPTFWYNSAKSASKWTKAELKAWMGHYVDY